MNRSTNSVIYSSPFRCTTVEDLILCLSFTDKDSDSSSDPVVLPDRWFNSLSFFDSKSDFQCPSEILNIRLFVTIRKMGNLPRPNLPLFYSRSPARATEYTH